MNKQSIVLDMDGTLLDPNGNVSKNVHDLIIRLRKSGIYVFLATGRTRTEINDVLPETLIVDGVVAANGMETYIGNKQLDCHVLDQHVVDIVVNQARAIKMYYEIHPLRGARYAFKDDKEYMNLQLLKPRPDSLLDNEYLSRIEALESKIDWIDKRKHENIVKIYFFSMDIEILDSWKVELKKLKDSFTFSTSSSSLHNVEIMVNGVSKANGIKQLLKEYNLSTNNLLAIGDGENDLSMFALANKSVAMKNASDFVKAKADQVTNYSYEEDGLYRYLKDCFQSRL